MPSEHQRVECYYFGILASMAGCQLHSGNQVIYERFLSDDFPVKPSILDGGLLPPKLSQVEGRAELVHLGGWTILTFWDRSADRRLNSSSAFVIRGWVDFAGAVAISRREYPQVWARFKFEVALREQGSN